MGEIVYLVFEFVRKISFVDVVLILDEISSWCGNHAQIGERVVRCSMTNTIVLAFVHSTYTICYTDQEVGSFGVGHDEMETGD